MLLGEIHQGLIGNGLDEAIIQKIQRKAESSDRLCLRNSLLNLVVRKSSIGANRAIVHERTASDHFGSVSDRDVGSDKPSVRSLVANAQFRDLRRRAGNGTLMTFAAGLGVEQGAEAVASGSATKFSERAKYLILLLLVPF